jgi:predicted MFS family arabinose efflux permease
MITTLRNRNFSLLWLAGLISLMGNWMLITALPFHIYTVTGSALATSGWLIAYILPGVLFSSVAGVFVDRWDRRRTMIVVNILQMVTIPFLLLVRSPELIWIVYIVGFVESTLSQFFGPAESALLPTLIGEENLTAANSLNSLNDNLARIIGSALGGLLLGVWGLGSVVVADAASYFCAAVLITLIAAPTVARQAQEQAAATMANARDKFTRVWQEWIEGLKVVAHSHVLSRTFIIVGVALFADAILSALLVVYMQGDVGLNATEFGWTLTARGVGGLIGGLVVAQFGSKLTHRQLAGWGLIGTGGLLLIILVKPTLLIILVTITLAGLPAIAWIVALQTLLQQETTDAYRGRVFGALGTTISLLMLVGSALAGVSADWLGAPTLMLAAALIYILSGLMALAMLKEALTPKPDTATMETA